MRFPQPINPNPNLDTRYGELLLLETAAATKPNSRNQARNEQAAETIDWNYYCIISIIRLVGSALDEGRIPS
jgi:hypothetical protein